MKCVVVVLGMLLLFSTAATAGELQVESSEIDGNTVLICHVPAEMGEIDMAYIKFNGGDGKGLPGGNCDMGIAEGNILTYVLPGVYQVIEGTVQVFFLDLSKDIISKDFVVRK